MSIQSFRDLDAWRVGMDLTVSFYKIIDRLPVVERFELASQMRRAAVSVPSNVAEGHAAGGDRRYRNHVRIAIGSLAELSTCLELCGRLGYIAKEVAATADKDLARARQLLHGLHRSILLRLSRKGAAVAILLYIGGHLS
jgi:four helix bundle protein